MIIYLGTDHAGYDHKEAVKAALISEGYEVEDMGAHHYDEQDDYPDFIYPVAQAVAKDPLHRRGIVLGGSGTGEAIVANKVPGIRACIGFSQWAVLKSREHNDANVLSFGARTVTTVQAVEWSKLWLKVPFSGDQRHVRRIAKVKAIESELFKAPFKRGL